MSANSAKLTMQHVTQFDRRSPVGIKRSAQALTSAEQLLNDALLRTKERDDIAQDKAGLHKKQRAMAHLLLGAIADSRNDQ